mgnify:FL=1
MKKELPNPDQPVVKDALKAAVDKNADKKQGDYTADSWKAFSTALSNAEKILKNPNATSQEISDALNALKTAVADLKTVAEKKDEDNKKHHSSGSSSSSKSNTTSTTSAQTGDTAQPLLYVVLIAAAAAVLALIRRKRMK